MPITLIGPIQLYTKCTFDRFVMDGIGIDSFGGLWSSILRQVNKNKETSRWHLVFTDLCWMTKRYVLYGIILSHFYINLSNWTIALEDWTCWCRGLWVSYSVTFSCSSSSTNCVYTLQTCVVSINVWWKINKNQIESGVALSFLCILILKLKTSPPPPPPLQHTHTHTCMHTILLICLKETT